MSEKLRDFYNYLDDQAFDKEIDSYGHSLFPEKEIANLNPLLNQYNYIIDSKTTP